MGFFMWSMLGLVMGSMFGSVMESFLDITLIKCIKGHKSEKSHTLCLNYKVSASQSASTQRIYLYGSTRAGKKVFLGILPASHISPTKLSQLSQVSSVWNTVCKHHSITVSHVSQLVNMYHTSQRTQLRMMAKDGQERTPNAGFRIYLEFQAK